MPLNSGAEIAAALREAEADGNSAVAQRYDISETRLAVLRRRYAGLAARQIDAIRTRRRLFLMGLGLALLGAAAYLTLPAARHAFEPLGALQVESTPTGALVLHNGHRLGETPFTRQDLAVGSHTLELRHPYAEVLRTEVEVIADQVVQYSFELTPLRASLRVLSNPVGAAIELDGQATGANTPHTFENLPAGTHTVAVSLPGRRGTRTSIEVLGSTEWHSELNLIPTGRLTLITTPAGARVELVDSGETYTAGAPLSIGEYHVRVSAPGYRSADLNVFLRAGREVRERVTLERITALLRLQVTPADAMVDVRQGGAAARPYQAGVALPTGTVHVRARAPGYRTATRTLQLGADGATVRLALEPVVFRVGEVFSDALAGGGRGPELVTIGPGRFRMGDVDGSGYVDEQPVHQVDLTQPFAISRREISRAEFARFRPAELTATEERLPVVQVSFEDATAYAAWLSNQTGANYRLPSEAEWEYVARAGTDTRFFFGSQAEQLCRYANIADRELKALYRAWEVLDCSDGFARDAPVGSLEPNPWGVYDIYGNASEWVEDCWHRNYEGAPTDGSVWTDGNCASHMVRGGSWDSRDDTARSSYRNSAASAAEDRGIRLVRDL